LGPEGQKSEFMRNPLLLWSHLGNNGYDSRRPGNSNVAILL